MVDKCASLKCSGYASNEKKQIAKFHFPLKNVELKKLWNRFVNRRDWLAAKDSVLRELHSEEKYLRRGKKCIRQWSMNPVPTVYPQKFSAKPSPLSMQQTTCSLPRKRSNHVI